MKLFRYNILAILLGFSGCAHYQERKLEPEKTLSNFDDRSLDNAKLKSFLATNHSPSSASWQAPQEWDLDTLTLVAFYYHPSLDLARAQWDSAKAAVRTGAGRPNPTIGLIPGYNFNAASGVSPWIPEVTYDLPIETAGKRGRRIDRAEHLSAAARLNIVTAAWLIRSGLRASLLDFMAATRRQQALQALLQSEQTILQLLEQRLGAGAISPSELFPARVSVLKTRSDLIDIRRQLADARARIAEALGVPLKSIAELKFDFSIDPPATWTEGGFPDLRRRALQGRADLLAGLAEYEASQSALQLEIAKQYPDIHLGSNYQWDQGENKWLLGVTFELPVLNRNQGPIAEAEAKRSEAAARFATLQAKAISEVDRAMSTRQAIADQLKEAEALVQTHRQQLATIQSTLEKGGADRVEVETAALEVRNSELTLLELRIKAQQAIGQIEDALQRPFDSLRLVEQDPKRAVATKP
jgi:cobalt-zinc-cadmium efflux system outer membrane protein